MLNALIPYNRSKIQNTHAWGAAMNGLDTDQMHAFLTVLDTGGFSAAGRRLGRDGSVISRRVAALEARLGIRLLERSTRRISATEAGMRFRDSVREAFALISQAEDDARSAAAAPTGLLRLSFPLGFGRLWIAPLLPDFMTRYPDVRVEASYTDRYVDLIAEGFDASVRIGKMNDNRLVARRLTRIRRLLCASPAYLARHAPPNKPEDLLQHDCIGFSPLSTHPLWHFKARPRRDVVGTAVKHGMRRSVRIEGRLVTDDIEAARQAALAGMGVLLATDWLVSRELKAGLLVPILSDWIVEGDEEVNVVRASLRYEAAKTRAFVDWIVAALGVHLWT